MKRAEFAEYLREKLKGRSETEVNNSIAYYIELINEHMDEGIPEEEAVAAMGNPEKIAAQLLEQLPVSQPAVSSPAAIQAESENRESLSFGRIFGSILLWILGGFLWLTAIGTSIGATAVLSVGIELWIYNGYAVGLVMLGLTLFLTGLTIGVILGASHAMRGAGKLLKRSAER